MAHLRFPHRQDSPAGLRTILVVLVWLSVAGAVAAAGSMSIHALRHPPAPTAAERMAVDYARHLRRNDAVYREPAPGTAQGVLPGLPLTLSVLGVGMRGARAISMLSLVLSVLLLGSIVLHETGSRTAAAAAAGMLFYSAMFLTGSPGGALSEPLALLLVIAGFACLRMLGDIRGALVGSFLLAAACFTHGLAWPFLIAAFGHTLVRSRRSLVAMTLGTAVFLGVTYVMMSRDLGPWFNSAAWESMAIAMRTEPARLVGLASHDMLGTFSVMTLTIVLSFALPTKPWQGVVGVWMWLAFGAVAATALAVQGGGASSLLPTIAALALAGPVVLDRLVRHLASLPNSSRLEGRDVLFAALALQFFELFAAVPGSALRPPF